MTPARNARIAGFTFLFYIAVGILSMVLSAKVTAGGDIPAKLASIAQHAPLLRFNALLGIVQAVCAMVLAVTLYAITRAEDSDLAMLGLTFRVGEGLLGAVLTHSTLDLLWLATTAGPDAPNPATVQALAPYLLGGSRWNAGAFFFAIGSTFFSYLLLRGRTIPVPLAWLGVIASVLLVIGLPLQLVGVLKGLAAGLIWIPMAAYEVPLGFWLLIKGVPSPPIRATTHADALH